MKSAMAALAYIEGPPKKMLFIGMGIGAMPRYLAGRYPRTRMDIVEIDPDVVTVAKQFFQFSETPDMHILIDDGARFVQTSREMYDVIFLDACFGVDIPEQLSSMEFFQHIRARLCENGILASNLASPVLNPGFNNLLRTACAVFPIMNVLSTENPANLILIAGKQPLATEETIRKRAKTITAERHFDFDLEPLAWQWFLHTPCIHLPAP
jgi:spermidine synthase